MNKIPKAQWSRKRKLEYLRLKTTQKFNNYAVIDVNVVIGKRITKADKLLFFQRLDSEEIGWYGYAVFLYYETCSFPQLMCDLGFFTSRGNAYKAGWGKEIPIGFSMHDFKGYNHITILNRPKRNKYPLLT